MKHDVVTRLIGFSLMYKKQTTQLWDNVIYVDTAKQDPSLIPCLHRSK